MCCSQLCVERVPLFDVFSTCSKPSLAGFFSLITIASIIMDSAGSTGPFSTGLSFPVDVYFAKADHFCPVHFRVKLMKIEAFSISMDVVAQ
jgi:hypothetical protein